MLKTILFQENQFNISTQFKCQKQFYFKQFRILSGVTTPGQSGPGSHSNEKALHIPQSSRMSGASSSDCLAL